MHSKCFSQDARTDMVNPFVHRLEIKTTYEKFRTGVLTLIFLPVRLVIIIGLLVVAWSLAVLGLIGLDQEELLSKPITGYRKRIKEVIAWVMRTTYQVGGMNVIVRGVQAPREEAPIMVIAPHSTFLDAGIVYITGFPSIICRRESGTNPWLGKLINYTQPIYVRREDPDSRQRTIQEIINRANSKEDWSQILIFPEGTCTNRSCLIRFKCGAFYPGVPIQPVLIRYPNKLDTVTWTWDGPGALKLLWLTLVQPKSNCEIEFLPVYHPSKEEQEDPRIYANNVRKLMAKNLGVPTLDYTYDDCKLVSRAKKLSFSKSSSLLQAHQLRVKLGLSRSHIEEKLISTTPQYLKENSNNRKVNFETFTNLLSIDSEDYLASDLFNLYNPDKSGKIDFREYLLSVLLVYKAESKADMIRLAFELCGGNDMKVSKKDFGLVMKMVLDMDEEDSRTIYKSIVDNTREKLVYEKFENYARNQGEFSCIYGGALRRLSLGRESDEKNK